MQIRSLHPGVTAEQVDRGDRVRASSSPEATSPSPTEPTEEELRILREDVDPTGARLREFR